MAVASLYLAIGFAAGVLAGLLGVGGGLVIVPSLIAVFLSLEFAPQVLTQVAVATSLATIIFTGTSSFLAHHKRGAVDWTLAVRLMPSIMLGSLFGAWLAERLDGRSLQQLFGAFSILAGLKMLIGVNPTALRKTSSLMLYVPAGAGIGALSSLLGIGGGTITVPLLSATGVPMQRAVGTSSACGVGLATAGSIGFIWHGADNPDLPNSCWGFVYLPALALIVVASVPAATLGARLAHRLPSRWLERLFALVLGWVGLRLLGVLG